MRGRHLLRGAGGPALRQRMEELARAAAERGARVQFLPTVGHAAWFPPVLVQLLAGIGAIALGWASAPISAALLLALAIGALHDLEGGRGWVRRMLPRSPGWVASMEIPGPGQPTRPTLLLWIPGTRKAAVPWLLPLLDRLRVQPLKKVQLRLALGTLGATWSDDLEVFLRNRWEPLDRGRCLILALQPGPGPLRVVLPDGLLGRSKPPAHLVQALRAAGLSSSPGTTGARRARRLGFRALGLRGGEGDAATSLAQLEAALRCLDELQDLGPSRHPEAP